jgi:hypothetical protein
MPLQSELIREIQPFVLPLMIAPNLDLDPEKVRNATGMLIRHQNAEYLVTCYHVWNYLQEIGGVLIAILGDGCEALHIRKPTLFRSDEALDLAVIEFTGVPDFGEKTPFVLGKASIYECELEDILVTVGFPEMWRESKLNFGCFRYGPLPLVVGTISDRSMVVAEANPLNQEVFAFLDAHPRLGNSPDPCSGLSGSPAFFVNTKPFRIAGFVSKRGCGGCLLPTNPVIDPV